MANLYLIESPLQLLSAFEAIGEFGSEENEVWIRYSNKSKSDQQLKFTSEKLLANEDCRIKEISISGANRNIIDYFKILFYKLYVAAKLFKYQKIFVGNFDSKFINAIIPFNRKMVLLDDGAKTINIQHLFTNDENYNWFTMFDLKPFKNQTLYQNRFPKIRGLLSDFKTRSNSVLFIGSKLSECNIITESYNVELISKISKRYCDYEIEYVPHRGDSSEKLSKLNDIPNLEILNIDYPVELLGLYNTALPVLVVSFYSTALISLNKIYKIPAFAFKFNYDSSSNKTQIETVYKYCSKYITVVEEKDI